MGSGDEDFLALLRATFRAEAQEHVESISASLVALERTDSSGRQGELVDSMFREVHSLNGAAGAADEAVVARICHDVESLLSAWKKSEAEPTPAGIDSISRDLDRILELIGGSGDWVGLVAEPASRATGSEPEIIDRADRSLPSASGQSPQEPTSGGIAEPVALLPTVVDDEIGPSAAAVPAPAATENTIRVAQGRIDDLLLVAEELLAAKVSNERHASAASEFAAEVARWRKNWSVARSALPDAERMSVQDVQLVVKLLDRASAFSDLAMEQASELAQRAQEDRRVVGPLVDDLLAQAGRVAMLPFASIVGMYPKTVRDLARVQGKMAEADIVGGDIELDRRVLEQLRDPLLHAIRNAVNHGIELPAERQAAGKDPVGRVRVEASRGDDGRAVVVVSDDGRGLDDGEITKAARRAGLATSGADAEDPSAWVFAMGVSTSPEVTGIAGRGVGLSVVKENIAALEGDVTFESVPGVGAALRMVVPTTRATIHGVVLEVAGRPFVLPIAGLQGVIRIANDDVLSTVRVPTVLFNGQVIPLVELTDVLAVAPSRRDAGGKHLQAFVLSSGAHTIAFVVDAILIEQSILVKPLGPLLDSIPMISGATLLPNGRVAPVLEARGVLATARRLTTGPARDSVPTSTGSQTDDEGGDRSRSVLIAEDSMTSRMMLRNILMTAGYDVRTAVDGADALASLSAEEFDAVVSDVEMPNMNGFELTAAIRADKALSHLPVILVTSLESPQDKARGMEVGASAYLVKNRFDQFRLLDTLRNLIEQASDG